MPIKLKKLKGGEIAVIEFDEELGGENQTDEIRSAVLEISAEGNRKLVFDLRKIKFLDSSTVGALLSAHVHYSKLHGEVKLAGLNKAIKDMFVMMKLLQFFDVHDTQESAVAEFSGSGK